MNVVSWEVDGEKVDLDLDSVTATEWCRARYAIGLGASAIVSAALREGDPDATAALIWLARCRTEPVDFAQVADGITFGSF